jgi:site-specific recombinase XerD
MKKITIHPCRVGGHDRIAIKFEYDESIIRQIRKIPGRKWAPEDRFWHIEYSEDKLSALADYLSSPQVFVDDSSFYNKREKLHSQGLDPVEKQILGSHNGEHIRRFREWMETRRYSRRSIDTYAGLITIFLLFYNDRSPSEITIEDINRFNHEFIIKKGYSISYQRQMVSAMKLFYQQIQQKKLDINELERPRKEKKLPVVFSKDEVRRIIGSIKNEKHRVMISLIYAAGLRISELLNLKCTDIDGQRLVIHIHSAKGRKDRIVPLGLGLVDTLREYYRRYRPMLYLFEGKEGKKYSASSCRIILKRALDRNGISKPGSLHTLRHSYATHLLESGTDIRYIQKLLGHESSRTTEIYTHVSRRQLEGIKSPYEDLDL